MASKQNVGAMPEWMDNSKPGGGQMMTMFSLPANKLAQAGIEISLDNDGNVTIGATVCPCNYFHPDFARGLVQEVGDREADRILDAAGRGITAELFMVNFKKLLT